MKPIKAKLSTKDGMFIVEDYKLELFVLSGYVDKRIATISGSKVTSLALLPARVFPKDDKTYQSGTMFNPTITDLFPSDIETRKLKIYPESEEKTYLVLIFHKGDRLCPTEVIRSLDNTVLFTEAYLSGNLDTNIPYNLLSRAWITNMLLNDVSLNVPVTIIELVRKKLCRDRNDATKTFASVLGKNPKTRMVAYRFANARELCGVDSVFSGLSFEDMNSMLDYAINTTNTGREQNESPLEQIIKL